MADQLNNLRQDRTLSDYQEAVSEASPETYEAEMQAALAHNAAITENTFAGDLFAGEGVQADDEYNALLNLNGDGVMGMISIPKINQTIPIYHGTDDSVLQVGADVYKRQTYGKTTEFNPVYTVEGCTFAVSYTHLFPTTCQ